MIDALRENAQVAKSNRIIGQWNGDGSHIECDSVKFINGDLCWINKKGDYHSYFHMSKQSADLVWTLVPPEPKEVSFMDAAKALHNGKRIIFKCTRCDGKEITHIFDNAHKLTSDKGWTIDASAVLEGMGKWYIEEV
jgi:hypothetical protein